MGVNGQPWDERTGIDELDDPGGLRRRRGGLLDAMNSPDAGRGADVGAIPRTAQSPRLADRINDDITRHPQGDAYPNVDYGSINMSTPGNSGRNMSRDLEDWYSQRKAEYDKLSQPQEQQPMSTRNKILRGIALAAPAVLGGVFGGASGAAAGAAGSLRGYEQGQEQRQAQQNLENAQRDQQKGRLLQDIGSVLRTREQEGAADRRASLAEEMANQRAAAGRESQERLFGQQNQLEATREANRQATLKQAMDEQEKRLQQQFGQQEKLETMREGAADRRQAASERRSSSKEDQRFQQTASKRYETAMDAEQRLSRMEASYKEATTKGDQQAMLALLTDHIGMTLGLQKGARITKDILQEATASQPFLEKIGAKFDQRGYLSGVTLGKDQMRQMLQLGYGARDRAVQGAYDDSKLYGVAPPKGADAVFGKRKVGDMPALQGGGEDDVIEYVRGANGKLVQKQR